MGKSGKGKKLSRHRNIFKFSEQGKLNVVNIILKVIQPLKTIF